MPAESKGRPKAKRKFKWFPKEGDFGKWFEDMNYDPENKDKEPEWVDATFVPTGDTTYEPTSAFPDNANV